MRKFQISNFKFQILIAVSAIAIFFFTFGRINNAYATCSPPNLSVKNTTNSFTYSPGSGVVINDEPSQNNSIRVIPFSVSCGSNPLYKYNIYYWNGSSYQLLNETGWLNSWYSELNMSAGEREYSVDVWAKNSETGEETNYTENLLYGMTKTGSSSGITANSASLAWSLRMNHYAEITSHDFYLLYGTDPAILSDRTQASGEIDLTSTWWFTDYDATTGRITWNSAKVITGLNPCTTYYWRVRAHHPNGTNTFFAGGSFTTTGACPTPSPTPTPTPSGPHVYCGSGEARSTGLVSAPDITGNFGSTGACINDPKTAFASYEIPTYEDLKSIYFTQSKAAKTDATPQGVANQDTITSALNNNDVILINKDTEIRNPYTYSKTAVVFIDGNLSIDKNLTASNPANGLVFVVSGNVNIAPDVTRIDAVIISSGTIFTAGANCSYDPANPDVAQLVVNGGLVSLDGNKPIKFCRKTAQDSTAAAEKIVHQPKYLIILRNLFATNQEFWSEVP